MWRISLIHRTLSPLYFDSSASIQLNLTIQQVINSAVTSIPTNPLSRFNKLNIKPALGSSFTYTTDATLLIQETGKVFGMLDEEERERIKKAPGLRGSVEIVRSRISVSFPPYTMRNKR